MIDTSPPCPHCGSRNWIKNTYDESHNSVYVTLTCTRCGRQLTKTMYEDRHGVLHDD